MPLLGPRCTCKSCLTYISCGGHTFLSRNLLRLRHVTQAWPMGPGMGHLGNHSLTVRISMIKNRDFNQQRRTQPQIHSLEWQCGNMGKTTPWWHWAAKLAALEPPPSWHLKMQRNFFLILKPLLVGLSSTRRPKHPDMDSISTLQANNSLVPNVPPPASSSHSYSAPSILPPLPHPYIFGWQILSCPWRSRLTITFSPIVSSISSSGPT